MVGINLLEQHNVASKEPINLFLKGKGEIPEHF
jgi:hypothetical protein